MSAVFIVSPVDDGYFQFQYVNSQNEMLMTSAEFENKLVAEKAIQDVRVGSLMSQLIAKGQTPDGDMFFVIKNNGGDVIAKSILFDNEMLFDNALHNVKENACIAKITYMESA